LQKRRDFAEEGRPSGRDAALRKRRGLVAETRLGG